MAQLKVQLPQTPDVEWQDVQFPFDGAWMPNSDPALIGPRNFATLTNMRYNDKSIEGVNGYSKINTTALIDYDYIDNGIQLRTDRSTNSFILVHSIDATGQGRVYQNTTEPGVQGDFDGSSKLDVNGNAYFEDASLNLKGRFSTAPQNSVAYCNGEESLIYSGFEFRTAAVFLQKDDATTNSIKDVSDTIESRLESEYISLPDSDFDELIILTTRPIQGIKFYIETANVAAGAMTVTQWDGDSWAAIANGSDGTDVGGATLAQTGIYSFDHTVSTVKLKHYQELYLYAYKVTVAAGVSANIYHISVDPAMQPIQNVWDGVYRQPIQFQVLSAGSGYEDYTLQVNQSSDLNAPIGAQIDGLVAATDKIFIMFEEQMSAIRFTMLGGLVNKAVSVINIDYWDGDSWKAVTNMVDGTLDDGGTISFNTSGLVSWTPESDEQKRTRFGSLGYMYRIGFTGANLTGTKGGDAEVLIDLCAGIPQLKPVGAYDFSLMYKNRLMLCGMSSVGEGNRVDFSAPSAPDVYNGTESSDNGINSLYFGGTEKVTGGAQLFNRFGASIFSMLIMFKDMETYLMTGDTVDEFLIYPVSTTVGCPAPLTITTTELAPEGTENFARNFVLWLSHSGPMMFDGAVLVAIKGIENYFDPNKAEYINWDYAYKARAWIDPNYKEWNLVFPSGGATEPDTWVVYDLQRRKWFRKIPPAMPISGFTVMSPSTGEQFTYGGLSTGYMMHLENGNNWDSTGITQVIKTGDFWPTNNIWDLTLLRKFKLVAEKIVSSSDYSLDIYYYANTEESEGQSMSFEDSDVSAGIAVDFTDDDVEFAAVITTNINLTLDVGLARVVRKTIDLNYLAFCHAFQFEVTTDDVEGGFRPIVWGVRFRRERADDTAN